MIVEFLQEAEEEFDMAASYYQEQSSGLGLDFISEVERTCTLISASPTAYTKIHNDIRWKLVRRFPFSVIYKVKFDFILIVAVAHQSREPGYWLSRM